MSYVLGYFIADGCLAISRGRKNPFSNNWRCASSTGAKFGIGGTTNYKFMSSENRPKIGVGVIVLKDGKVPLGKRRGSHGEGSWSLPGGHLEFGESFENCAKREVMEETGMRIRNIRFGTATNDIFEKEDKHYVTLYLLADWESGELKLVEPEKFEKWEWFEWGKFPEPLFLPLKNLLAQKYNPFEY